MKRAKIKNANLYWRVTNLRKFTLSRLSEQNGLCVLNSSYYMIIIRHLHYYVCTWRICGPYLASHRQNILELYNAHSLFVI